MASRFDPARDKPAAALVLDNGAVFMGYSVGAPTQTVGEVVFNTSMTGYQEILTDPSYFHQIVLLTHPHVGNCGVNAQDSESNRVCAAGLILRSIPGYHKSHWRSTSSLGDYLQQCGVPAIAGVDTRQLTCLLRNTGSKKAALVVTQTPSAPPDIEQAIAQATGFPGLANCALADRLCCAAPTPWTKGASWLFERASRRQSEGRRFHVVAYDFGVKQSILACMVEAGCDVTRVPARTTAKQALSLKPDGIFLSNGPGDPEPCGWAIDACAAFLKARIPLFGVCLGHQILALATGGNTQKMKFGHHGANHPVQDLKTGKVYITSQNHGFTVDPDSLPRTMRITHRSLFDGSIQGLEHTECPAFSLQGHPEASPGPRDMSHLFDRFVDMMAAQKRSD